MKGAFLSFSGSFPHPPVSFAGDLLTWYDQNARVLPWRKRGACADPYHVWISEVMLQQTTVATVIPYFLRFLARWPTLFDFAQASEDEVLHMWQGLGYYTRARSLLQCARVLMEHWGGHFPETEAELLSLPGIGPYTAAALLAIAFERTAVALDGNILRVLSRHAALAGTGDDLKAVARAVGQERLPQARIGDYTQALMDLGATVCTPRSPLCAVCPVAKTCLAFLGGQTDVFPHRAPSKPKPHLFGDAFWVERTWDGAVLFQKESRRRLLAGLLRLPLSEFGEAFLRTLPLGFNWALVPGEVSHTFTHFKLTVRIWQTQIDTMWTGMPCNVFGSEDDYWIAPHDFSNHAFSTLMRKVLCQLSQNNAENS